MAAQTGATATCNTPEPTTLAQALTSGLADTLNQRYLHLLSHSQNSQPCAIAPALLCQLFCNSKSQFQSHYSISLSYLPEKSYNDTLLDPCLTRMNSGPRMTQFPCGPRPAEGAIHLPCMRSAGHLDSGSMLACNRFRAPPRMHSACQRSAHLN